MIQDVTTLHGSQFKDAAIIVASPPCQKYSYMAMPWGRSKAMAAAIRADETGASTEELNRLFNACFRIQREACEAAGRHIPLIVENVRGAIPWVGRSRWNFGSYYLWGDVPALMPPTVKAKKFNPDGTAHPPGSWFGIADSKNRGANSGQKVPGFRFDGSGKTFQTASVEGLKTVGQAHIRDGHGHTRHLTNQREHDAAQEGRKHHGDQFRDPACPSRQGGQLKPPARVSAHPPAEGRKGAGAGAAWFDQNTSSLPSNSVRRKQASAMIAKIPLALSLHLARVFKP